MTIRFANFSQLVKQQSSPSSLGSDINALFNHHLMALLGGYLSMGGDDDASGEAALLNRKKVSDIIDKSEEALLKNKGGNSENNWQS